VGRARKLICSIQTLARHGALRWRTKARGSRLERNTIFRCIWLIRMQNLTKAQRLSLLVSKLLILIGFSMVAAMMYFESEPGLLPLAVTAIGIAMYFGTKYQSRDG